MAGMKELSALMKELEDKLSVCMRCGMCQAVCPLFSETGRESDVARGKLALLDGLIEELFKDPDGVYDRLNKCLLCGSCAANCPSGVDVIEIFMKARGIITGFKGLSLVKKMILRGLLARPKLFDRFLTRMQRIQKVFVRPAHAGLGTSCARMATPLLGHRHVKTLSARPFRLSIPAMRRTTVESDIRVAFFVGCLVDKVYPDVARATIEVLDYHDISVYIPETQACCGIPAVSSGDVKAFHRLVQYNLDVFNREEFDYLITSCATCAATIKKVWPMWVRHEPEDYKRRVEKMAGKVMDVNQFLVSSVELVNAVPKQMNNPVTVTYHDPCHLRKSLCVSEEPRTLIKAHPGYQLKEMSEPDRCCGLGGSFNLQYYEISASIGALKKEQIKSTGSAVVCTGCPACMIQISDMLSQAGETISIKHPIEIYKELIRENDRTFKTDKAQTHIRSSF